MSRTKSASKRHSSTVFDREYARLNLNQKNAVDTIEGPVMVVAGPGTGKTQVLSLRVANILRKTQMSPRNILCLTFSNAGATAMRERLRTLIGGAAYQVTVKTCHAFADLVIQRHPWAFEAFSAERAVSEIERVKMMQEIIDSFDRSALTIDRKNPYGRIHDLLGRFSECKREGKSLEDLKNVATLYDRAMEGKSRAGTKADRQNREKAQKFREFIKLFESYQSALQVKRLYDYDDMILTAIEGMAHDEALLAGLQERYQYVLVDEAQDLNGAQWKMIELLTTLIIAPHEPNFFLVGDDDQAIYRFQGANVLHLLAFHEKYPAAPVIVLTENYRSTQAILDVSERLINHNDERLVGKIPGLTKHLVAKESGSGSGSETEPILLRPPSNVTEPWMIADLIEERMKQGIDPDEIAILVQTNNELRPLYDVLTARKIPVILEGKADLFTHPLVRQAVSLLTFIVNPDAKNRDDLFQRAIACENLGCDPTDLSRVAESVRSSKESFVASILALEQSTLPLSHPEIIIQARDLLLDLSERRSSRTVLETVERVLRALTSEALSRIDPYDLAVVDTFFHFVQQWCLDHPREGLASFMDDIAYYAGTEWIDVHITFAIPHVVASGVRLLTAHQSKGLEFHTVILSNFSEGHWEERTNPRKLSLPEDLLFGWESEQKTYEKHQDERRVAYVAMTRAKRELIFVCPREYSVGEKMRTQSPSAFVAEAAPIHEENRDLKDPAHASILWHPPVTLSKGAFEAYIQERLQEFALSASSLSHFLEDPQKFLYQDLLHQPEERIEADVRSLAYGNAVHWALRQWGAAIMSGKTMDEGAFLQHFQDHLSERTILTEAQRSDLTTIAQNALPRYFAAILQGRTPYIYAIERDYRAEVDDVPIKGKIDRIDQVAKDSNAVIVIDYKTGKPKAPAVIRGGIDEGAVSRTSEGSLFRQLVFYALLLEHADPFLHPMSFNLEFIGEAGEDPITRSFTVTESEKDDLRTLIAEVWRKVKAMEFTAL